MTDVIYTITVERNDEVPPMFRYRGKLRSGSALIDMTHQFSKDAVERVFRAHPAQYAPSATVEVVDLTGEA